MSDTATSTEAPSGRGRVREARSLLFAVLAALALFMCLGAVVSAHPRSALDDMVRDWASAMNSPVGTSFFTFVSTVGSVNPMIAYAFIVIVLVAIYRRSIVPLTSLLAPIAVVAAYLGTKSVFVRARPSGMGNAFEGTYSFPSAHATTSSAVCFAVAYLLYREGTVSQVAAASGAAVICLLIGVSRIYLDVHWATDILGGWCLGLAIGATASALYESSGGPSRRELPGQRR